MQSAESSDESGQMPGVLDIHRREFEPLTDTSTDVADNRVGANLPILDKKMKARGGTLRHGFGRLDEKSAHTDVANPGDVAAITALPINPDVANGNRERRDPRRKSSGR